MTEQETQAEILSQTPPLAVPPAARRRLAAEPTPGGHPMELWISHALRAGVLLAGAIIALGLVLLLVEGASPATPVTLDALRARGGRPLAVQPAMLLRRAPHGHPTAVIQVGVLALILTPLWRVAMTIGLFLAQRDRAFVLITAVVLSVLVLGLIGAGA